jgi:hypothetical protein
MDSFHPKKMRVGFLELEKVPKFEFYKTVEKPGSRFEYSIKLTDELKNLGKKFSTLPLKFASLIQATPSNNKHQEFHADSEDGERALLYLTDVENESNGPVEFQKYGKILGKAGTFVHYSANEVHRGCASDINRYALAFAFDSSEKTITTIGVPIEDNCTTLITCPSGFVYRNPLPNSGPYSVQSCCVAVSEDKFPWVWIYVGVPILVVLGYFLYKYLNRGKL